ncbi:uracil phosphoribosyltransferase homolog [Phascolarctos cinereus]|uniref:Uracil phosphoribosyltransferase homolog n=1 Tax=Phascolarctos cinereus TaxID=38626 RepID=A0A6P5IE16_PHACI|nr:uracil phosphoribosyltransferase homolog [Phascolarctos cinereus]
MAKELRRPDTMPCHNQQLAPAATASQCPEPAEPGGGPGQDQVGGPAKLPANGAVAGPAGDSAEGPPPEDREPEDLSFCQLGPQLKLLPMNDQIRELQTIIRDKTASRGDFMFSADRLIRLVVEEGLNQLPYKECTVTTPTGYKYEGVKFEKGNCGVSIMRSGEAMEQGLRDCCRSIRIGKILIQSDEETQRAKVYYAKFPPDIYRRKVLLMYPILSTGNTVIEAVKVLIEHGVQPSVIIVLSLFSTPHGATSIIQEFPDITILTTEVHPVAPTHFGQKYFGTD